MLYPFLASGHKFGAYGYTLSITIFPYVYYQYYRILRLEKRSGDDELLLCRLLTAMRPNRM